MGCEKLTQQENIGTRDQSRAILSLRGGCKKEERQSRKAEKRQETSKPTLGPKSERSTSSAVK
jgi:hypothetical protein